MFIIPRNLLSAARQWFDESFWGKIIFGDGAEKSMAEVFEEKEERRLIDIDTVEPASLVSFNLLFRVTFNNLFFILSSFFSRFDSWLTDYKTIKQKLKISEPALDVALSLLIEGVFENCAFGSVEKWYSSWIKPRSFEDLLRRKKFGGWYLNILSIKNTISPSVSVVPSVVFLFTWIVSFWSSSVNWL